MTKPLHLEHLNRTNHEDTHVIVNRLIDVINAMSDRLHVVEQELVTQRGRRVLDDARQTHKRDDRQAEPL